MDGTCQTFSRLQAAVREAMREKRDLERDCLRNVVSEIKNATVNAGKPTTDAACIAAFEKAAKQRRDSIACFREAGRIDLAEKEEAELAVIEKWIPAKLSEEDTRTLLTRLVAETDGTKKSMGAVMKQLPADADKKLASKLLSGMLV